MSARFSIAYLIREDIQEDQKKHNDDELEFPKRKRARRHLSIVNQPGNSPRLSLQRF